MAVFGIAIFGSIYGAGLKIRGDTKAVCLVLFVACDCSCAGRAACFSINYAMTRVFAFVASHFLFRSYTWVIIVLSFFSFGHLVQRGMGKFFARGADHAATGS